MAMVGDEHFNKFITNKTPPIMRIDNDIKLDFKDVLIRPKRSTLKSRSQVDLSRDIRFKNSGRTLNCVPIMSANSELF